MDDSPSDFEATWNPRIGCNATSELRRYRRTAAWFLPSEFACAAAAGLLIGGGKVASAIGLTLAACAALAWVPLVRAMRRTTAAMSDWYGVKSLRALPSMRPEHFDNWRRAKGLKTPHERGLEGP